MIPSDKALINLSLNCNCLFREHWVKVHKDKCIFARLPNIKINIMKSSFLLQNCNDQINIVSGEARPSWLEYIATIPPLVRFVLETRRVLQRTSRILLGAVTCRVSGPR